MERKFRTSHRGIAAYLITKGYEIIRGEKGTNKSGRESIYLEFDIDPTSGREMGDAFFNGGLHGNLKEFYDAQYKVNKSVYETKNGE
jgi:hypothetical protein